MLQHKQLEHCLILKGSALSIIFILFLVTSCKEDYAYISHGLSITTSKWELILDNKLSFDIESPAYVQTLNDKECLVFSNLVNSSIDIYEIGTNFMQSRIELDELSKSKIIKLAGTYALNHDSILIINGINPTTSFYVNADGRYLQQLKLLSPLEVPYLNIVQTSVTPIITINDNLFFSCWELDVEGLEPEGSDFYYLWEYSSKNHRFIPRQNSYPKDYLEEGTDIFISGTVFNTRGHANKIISYFTLSDSIYIYDPNNNNNVKSKLNNYYQASGPYELQNKFIDYANATINVGLYYDELKMVYYNVKMLPVTNLDKIPQDYNFIFNSKPLAIEVLNLDFEYLGHLNLKSYEYTPTKVFTHKGKLYISKNNYLSNNLNEDRLTFEILEINVNEQNNI